MHPAYLDGLHCGWALTGVIVFGPIVTPLFSSGFHCGQIGG
jgi:hypothetical protein